MSAVAMRGQNHLEKLMQSVLNPVSQLQKKPHNVAKTNA